ncbi:MAG TPA: hypothetical protein VMF50_02315 [Candidatus Binataceae bacterium]|nr:hypothetical protein [Candidatus Binataceae bacterium]
MPALADGGAKEWGFIVLINHASGGQICFEPGVEVVADRDLAQLAAFLAEAQRAMLAEIFEIAEARRASAPTRAPV